MAFSVSLDECKAAMNSGSVCFWRPQQQHGYLGNWWASPCELEGQRLATSEHGMMFLKAKLFGDEETAQRLVQSTDPKDAKNLGRLVSGFDEATWKANRCEIMYRACMSKFTLDEELRQKLLDTGERCLIEASPYDRIWGIGMEKKDPRCRNVSQWRGENLLGRVLMAVRRDLKKS